MRIGEVAEQVGVNPKTIRYYEGIGLLPDPERLASGYREYTADDVDRLGFIRTAQRLGLSLSEISEILAFRERAEPPCEYVLGVLDREVADLDRRMAEMAQLRDELITLKGKADRLPRDSSCYCAVIEHTRAVADEGDRSVRVPTPSQSRRRGLSSAGAQAMPAAGPHGKG
ncbi:MAG: heavy metal-responsive transcriptional regulator [Actinobacteria bacterium]|nr:heavy metal-responsive transcriptional regulator [Actinomycetota bacterium]